MARTLKTQTHARKKKTIRLPHAEPLGEGEKLFRSARDVVLLSLLETQRLYGAELAHLYEWVTGEVIPSGSIYSTMRRLRERGLVRWTDHLAGVPATAKVYTLTDDGRSRLSAFRRACIMGRRTR